MANPCSGAGWQRLTAPYRQAWANAGAPCWLCDEPIDYTLRHPHRLALTVDHVVARWNGGAPLDPGNWSPSHASCNSSRGATEGNKLRRPTVPIRTSATW